MKKEMKMDGIMAVGENEEGLRTLDFECCERVKTEAFQGKYEVLGTRDGNIYMTEQKKRKKADVQGGQLDVDAGCGS